MNINNFSVCLLSAGTGSRLSAITNNKPKCLLKVREHSLITRIILQLKKKKLKKLSIIIGYKSQMIKNELKKIKGIKYNFIKIKDFETNGHAVSWYSFRKEWFKKKKPLLILHTDIYFDNKYLENLLLSKKTNIIGVHSNKNYYRKDSIVVKCNDKNQITKLMYVNSKKKFDGEVLGINKISSNTSKNLFFFMDKFLKNDNKKLSWEFMLNEYIKKTSDIFYIIKNQNYFWRNINYPKDYYYLIDNVK